MSRKRTPCRARLVRIYFQAGPKHDPGLGPCRPGQPYPQEVHNVMKVNASGFESYVSKPNNCVMDSESDKSTLAAPGTNGTFATLANTVQLVAKS
ncbi:hypothetical protein AMTR_s00058p00118440 [Amborella trichopoda]|uniref:Uncharacterized protein n=1 Tax=Amborella trichopoda TaxID=13333 RepID=W1P9H1_AMBTC|nr:hypothetical protein AMTR_s00058p00118440 [Amborella trichopoda]